MSNRNRKQSSSRRRVSVRAVRRANVDIGKLSRAVIALAQAEAAAQAEHEGQQSADPNNRENDE
jgi:hypothetical protein